MERRAFLKTLEWTAVGSLCSGLPALLGGCAGLRYVDYTREGDRLVVRRADFGEEPYVLLDTPQLQRAVYLHRLADGAFSALLTRCSHQGCQVEPAGDRLACPCHGSEYTFTGEVLEGPAEHPLHRYAVTTDAEHIYIDLSTPGRP